MAAQEDGIVEDVNWAQDAEGAHGEEVSLHLLMRVVADVGIVGLPNAGKSSLLAALTRWVALHLVFFHPRQILMRWKVHLHYRCMPSEGSCTKLVGLLQERFHQLYIIVLDCRASPEIAAYPFTTLMPNLGVLASGKQEAKAQDQYGDLDFLLHDSSNGSNMSSASGPVLADMPGLIQGAHAGRGLGRMFLRHLRRTQGLLHVVDASAGLTQPLSSSASTAADAPAAASVVYIKCEVGHHFQSCSVLLQRLVMPTGCVLLRRGSRSRLHDSAAGAGALQRGVLRTAAHCGAQQDGPGGCSRAAG